MNIELNSGLNDMKVPAEQKPIEHSDGSVESVQNWLNSRKPIGSVVIHLNDGSVETYPVWGAKNPGDYDV